MKFLPITTETSFFGWENFLALLVAVAIPGIAAFVWIAFFRKKRRRKRRRREESRREYAGNPTLAETGGLPPVRKPENLSDQPKS